MPSEKAKMLAGELYRYEGDELTADHRKACAWMDRYNRSHQLSQVESQRMLAEIMASVGAGAFIKPPFFVDYGFNTTLGTGAFLNFNCVILDQAAVTIGDFTLIGPGVQIVTADHPRDPVHRRAMLESAKPIRIGRHVWIGAGAQILPGVLIGDNAIIGAGSIVTRDVPEGATVVGNPARPIAR
jgi:maltose O-acetyltransferase